MAAKAQEAGRSYCLVDSDSVGMKDWTAVTLAMQLKGLSLLGIGNKCWSLDIEQRSAKCQEMARAAFPRSGTLC